MRTNYDVKTDPADVWRALRKSRQSPPGAASESYPDNVDSATGELTPEGAARVGTYRAAMEQAEQLMKAAASTGPAAQPLPLFYALSQFGRAVAAAAPVLDTTTREFRLKGHGVGALNLDGVDRTGLASVKVHGYKTGAFPSVAKALHASAMAEERSIGQVMGWIPGSSRFALDGVSVPDRAVLQLHRVYPASDHAQVVTIAGVPYDLLADAPTPNNGQGTLPRPFLADDPVLREAIERYPALDGWGWPEPIAPITSVRLADSRTWDVTVRIPAPTESDNDLRNRSVFYRGGFYAYPKVSGELTIHPFLAWWQILISLSMLARYQPSEWFTLIDVDKHQDAVPIESILTFCQQALPEIALRAIEDSAREPLLGI
jgi:hypothetical protein